MVKGLKIQFCSNNALDVSIIILYQVVDPMYFIYGQRWVDER